MSERQYSTMSFDELKSELLELSKQMYTLRMQKSLGVLAKNHMIKAVRKDIARVHTYLNQNKQAQQ